MARRKNRSKAEWQSLVEEYQLKYRGKSKSSFCRKKGVSATTFCKWYKEIKPKQDFIKVDLKPKIGYLKLFGLNLVKFELSV